VPSSSTAKILGFGDADTRSAKISFLASGEPKALQCAPVERRGQQIFDASFLGGIHCRVYSRAKTTSLAVHKSMVVVFTASLDSTHRLARLLQLLWAAQKYGKDAVGEFSSALNQQERAALMKRCNDPKDSLSVVVCSDGMSRGMDIEYVDAVINYDVPTLAKTYVHRCGRTARASRKGAAISLLKGGQVSLFFRMRRLIQLSERVQAMPVKKNLVRDAVDVYRQSIKALRDVLDAEENGELGNTETLEDYVSEVE
jgi:superfamily II DNA/RNA helicase